MAVDLKADGVEHVAQALDLGLQRLDAVMPCTDIADRHAFDRLIVLRASVIKIK